MSELIDLTRKKFGRLQVLRRDKSKRRISWVCKCVCGNFTSVQSSNLRSGASQSCGCLNAEESSKRHTTHGQSTTRLYSVWAAMKKRCQNKRHHAYERYGGRGIKVCKRWQTFENFFVDMSPRPKGKTLERRDNDGDYKPSNVYWATYKEQRANQRPAKTDRPVTFQGSTLTVRGWARKLKVGHSMILRRLDNNWSIEDALLTPSRKRV